MIHFTHTALARSKKERGFSLVETIVVVAILGVLVVVAIPVFGAIQTNAEREAIHGVAKSAVSSVAAAVGQGATRANIVANSTTHKDNILGKLNVQYAGKYFITMAPMTPPAAGAYWPGKPTPNTGAFRNNDRWSVATSTAATPEDVYLYVADAKSNWVGEGVRFPSTGPDTWQ